MYLVYEQTGAEGVVFDVYKADDHFDFRRHYHDVDEAIRYCLEAGDDDQCVVLLDESWFDMTCVVGSFSGEKFSTRDFYSHCEKALDISNMSVVGGSVFLSCLFHHVRGSSGALGYIVGGEGPLDRTTVCLFLKPMMYRSMKQSLGDCVVFPQSLGVVHQLVSLGDETDCVLLYLYDDTVKLISLVDGRYDHCSSINLGRKKLYHMIEEHGLQHVFSSDENSSNPLISRMLQDIFAFYCSMLIDRVLTEVPGTIRHVVLIGNYVISNDLFMTCFERVCQDRLEAYIVPFHGPSTQMTSVGDIALDLQLMHQHFDLLQRFSLSTVG